MNPSPRRRSGWRPSASTGRGQLVAKRVDLFRRRPLYWMRDGEHFVLSLGNDGWIVLSPTIGGR